MAQVYYGANVGQHAQDVAVATATNSTDVEVRVDTSKVTSREAAKEALTYILTQIAQQVFPFA